MITFTTSNLPSGSTHWLAMVGDQYWYELGKIPLNSAWQFNAPSGIYEVFFYSITYSLDQTNVMSTVPLGDVQLIDGKTYNYDFTGATFSETSQSVGPVVGSSGIGSLLALAGIGYIVYFLVEKGKK